MTESEVEYRTVFVVSSRAGGAVERNRIRRWLREDFRKLQADREIKGAFVIRFKGQAELIDHKSLGENLEKLYRKIEADE
jgi:ribonuclease P protein component